MIKIESILTVEAGDTWGLIPCISNGTFNVKLLFPLNIGPPWPEKIDNHALPLTPKKLKVIHLCHQYKDSSFGRATFSYSATLWH